MVISLLVGVFLGGLMALLYHELPESRSRFMVAGLIGAWICANPKFLGGRALPRSSLVTG